MCNQLNMYLAEEEIVIAYIVQSVLQSRPQCVHFLCLHSTHARFDTTLRADSLL
jgi:hypothetical protein